MQKKGGVVQSLAGRVVVGAVIKVLIAGTQTPATIYSDRDGTNQVTELKTNSSGEWGFYAPNGRYDIRSYVNGVLDGEYLDELLFDPDDADLGGGAGLAQQVANLQANVASLSAQVDVNADIVSEIAPMVKDFDNANSAENVYMIGADGRTVPMTALAEEDGANLIGNGASNVGQVLSSHTDTLAQIGKKLSETISVKDFGAVGDGVTNDAAAIQAAATAASGKVLFFPPGSYVVNDGFSMSGNNSHIIGYGATLIYNKTSSTYNHCVRLSGNNCSISGLRVRSPVGLVRNDTGFAISVGTVGTTTQNVTVRDCIIESIASAAIWFSNVRYAKAVGNTIFDCKADGIHFSDGCFNAVASLNAVSNCGDDAIAVVNDTAGAPLLGNLLIAGNIIEGGTFVGSEAGHGIALIGLIGGTISNNRISNTVEPGIGTYQWTDTANPADNLVIENNTLVNTGAGGPVFGGCGINLQETGKVIVRGNTIHNLMYDAAKICGAIRCTSSTDLEVSSNSLYDNACDGVVVTSATINLVILANNFGYSLRTPVLVSGAVGRCTLSGNAFNDNQSANDIDVNLPSTPVYLFGNRCGKAVVLVSNSNGAMSREEAASFSPAITAQTGTITTATGTMVYQRRGRFMYVDISVLVTTNGTGAGAVVASLPFSVVGGVLVGRENNLTGYQITGVAAGTSLAIRRYDNSYPGANGASMTLSGILRIS